VYDRATAARWYRAPALGRTKALTRKLRASARESISSVFLVSGVVADVAGSGGGLACGSLHEGTSGTVRVTKNHLLATIRQSRKQSDSGGKYGDCWVCGAAGK